jgi:hypothetical protein
VSRLSRQCGILNISQPYRPAEPVTGTALLRFTSHILHARCMSHQSHPLTRYIYVYIHIRRNMADPKRVGMKIYDTVSERNVTHRLDINCSLRAITIPCWWVYTVQSVQFSWAQSSNSDCRNRNTAHSSGNQSCRSRRHATLSDISRGLPQSHLLIALLHGGTM